MNPAISMIRVGMGRDVFQVPHEIWLQTPLVKIMPDGEGQQKPPRGSQWMDGNSVGGGGREA